MEDADKAVAERPQRLVVKVPSGPSLVVVGPAAGTRRQRAERPLVDGVVEASVANVSGEDGPLLSRSDGEWRRAGVVLARLGTGVSIGGVSELAQHPGAEYITESWQGEVDVGVRVLLKMVGEGRLRARRSDG